MPGRTTVGLVVTLVAVLVALTGCGEDADPGGVTDEVGELGAVVQGRLGDLPGEEHVVQTPSGQVRFVVGEPAEQVSASEAADGSEHAAPEGAVWVPIDWEFVPGAGLSAYLSTLMADDEVRRLVSVTAGGTTVELGDAGTTPTAPAEVRTSGIVYVVLPADETPVLEVDFAGVVTSVHAGTGELGGDGADALGDLPEPVDGDCSGGVVVGGQADVDCVYSVVTVPYLSGRGWSEVGWTVARVETRVDEFVTPEGAYATSGTTDGTALTGPRGIRTEDVLERFASLVTQTTGEGEATALEVTRTVEGTRTDGSGPDTGSVTYTARVPLTGG